MGDDENKIIPTDYVIESIKAEIDTASPSQRRRIIEAIVVAALGGIPWVGGVISASIISAGAAFRAGEALMPWDGSRKEPDHRGAHPRARWNLRSRIRSRMY